MIGIDVFGKAGMADSITTMDGIVAALQKASVGFGKQGSKPGKFVNVAAPPASALAALTEEAPQSIRSSEKPT